MPMIRITKELVKMKTSTKKFVQKFTVRKRVSLQPQEDTAEHLVLDTSL
jgi:hypothetical protein